MDETRAASDIDNLEHNDSNNVGHDATCPGELRLPRAFARESGSDTT
jgi:hypothetical protein